MSRLSAAAQIGIHEVASAVRIRIADLFAMDHPERIIFSPGTTMSLRLLLTSLGSKTIMLGAEEYCSEPHFYPLDVTISQGDGFVESVKLLKPDAVLLSVVSWKGNVFGLESAFKELRDTMGKDCPLLIADYSHGGAIGFPPLETLDADFIVGDLSKWVLPPRVADDLCLLYPTSNRFLEVLHHTFGSLFLATSNDTERAARWLLPEQLESASAWFGRSQPSRSGLRAQYLRNLDFKKSLITPNMINPDSCMLWLQKGGAIAKQISPDLLWETAIGTRILCRADVQEEYEKVILDGPRGASENLREADI